ncbi:MAG: hypothetical protein KAJ49_03980 [Arcobacteraceae bacterium]|nr:hypothetical protein [Arcobacteraceae bacterium]
MFNYYFIHKGICDIIIVIFIKGYIILHNQLLQQQIANEQEKTSIYNSLPVDIRTTLDDMAFGIGQKDGNDPFMVKQRMVSKVNMLLEEKAIYLIENMAILIEKSVHHNEQIDDKNVTKEFLTFLVNLYY